MNLTVIFCYINSINLALHLGCNYAKYRVHSVMKTIGFKYCLRLYNSSSQAVLVNCLTNHFDIQEMLDTNARAIHEHLRPG